MYIVLRHELFQELPKIPFAAVKTHFCLMSSKVALMLRMLQRCMHLQACKAAIKLVYQQKASKPMQAGAHTQASLLVA